MKKPGAWGGAQTGGGRRAVDGSTKVERVTITLTSADRAQLRELGGSPWIRSQIRAAFQRGGDGAS